MLGFGTIWRKTAMFYQVSGSCHVLTGACRYTLESGLQGRPSGLKADFYGSRKPKVRPREAPPELGAHSGEGCPT